MYFNSVNGKCQMKLGIKSILITGGSGKIGKVAIPRLLEAGFKLRAIQLPDEPVEAEGVETITGTLSDEQFVEEAIEWPAPVFSSSCYESI